MNDRELEKIIRSRTLERGEKTVLPCARAFAISREHSVSLARIGSWCNDNGVRISSCQLGCFD